MNYKLGERSRENLKHVHPDLILVVARAIQITEVDFTVLEGVRSVDRQKALIASGASSLRDPKRSRHVADLEGIAHAVDLGAWVGGIRWDWPLYHKIAAAMDKASEELKIPIEWGGRWTSFPDGPHFQLPWKEYPIIELELAA